MQCRTLVNGLSETGAYHQYDYCIDNLLLQVVGPLYVRGYGKSIIQIIRVRPFGAGRANARCSIQTLIPLGLDTLMCSAQAWSWSDVMSLFDIEYGE